MTGAPGVPIVAIMSRAGAMVEDTDWLAVTPADGVRRLVEESDEMWLERGDLVYSPGPPKHAFILVAGRTGAWRGRSDAPGDGVYYYITDAPLTTLCLENVIADIDYYGSMRVLSESAHVLAVPARALEQLLADHPATGLEIARHVARRLQGFAEQSVDLALLDTGRRLAKYLTRLAGPDGRTASMTQHELAGRLGMSRQSVNAGLSRFVQRGWMVRTGEGTYQLTDQQAMRQHAGERHDTGAEQFW